MTEGPDLPPWEIVLRAWRIAIENTGTALRMSVLPFLLLMALHRVIGLADPEGFSELGWIFIEVVVFPIPAALLLVPWYRHILSAQWPELAQRPAHWWYVIFMARTLVLELMLFAIQVPSAIAGIAAGQTGEDPDPQLTQMALFLYLALVPGFYLYARSALALPAAAAGGDHSYTRSWRVTGSAGWRITGIIFTLGFTFLIIHGVVRGAPTLPPLLESAVSAAVAVVGELVMGAGIALVYLHYSGGAREDVNS